MRRTADAAGRRRSCGGPQRGGRRGGGLSGCGAEHWARRFADNKLLDLSAADGPRHPHDRRVRRSVARYTPTVNTHPPLRPAATTPARPRLRHWLSPPTGAVNRPVRDLKSGWQPARFKPDGRTPLTQPNDSERLTRKVWGQPPIRTVDASVQVTRVELRGLEPLTPTLPGWIPTMCSRPPRYVPAGRAAPWILTDADVRRRIGNRWPPKWLRNCPLRTVVHVR